MRCRNQFRLEKLIIGEKPLESRASMYLHINRLLDVKEEERHQTHPTFMTMRIIYNQCLNDLSNWYDTSKNAMRHNINYVRSYRERGRE